MRNISDRGKSINKKYIKIENKISIYLKLTKNKNKNKTKMELDILK